MGRDLCHLCYLTPAFSGVLKKWGKIRSGYISPAFSRAQDWVELLHNPFVSRVPQKVRKLELAASPLPCRRPKMGWKHTITCVVSGVPGKGNKIRNCYITLAL